MTRAGTILLVVAAVGISGFAQTTTESNFKLVKDEAGRLTFLGFLFLVPEQAPMNSAKCREGALEPEKKSNPSLKVLGLSENV
jgi:hypothetical protein